MRCDDVTLPGQITYTRKRMMYSLLIGAVDVVYSDFRSTWVRIPLSR